MLRHHPTLRRIHIGTFPVDALARLRVKDRPRHLIYNMSPSYALDSGSHWLSIWLSADMRGEVVDSLGSSVIQPDVVSFLRRHCTAAVRTTKPLQDSNSAACGLYCLSHALHRARGESLGAWLGRFGSCRRSNDASVQCEFMRMLATPSLFSPRLEDWRSQVSRACRPAGCGPVDRRASEENIDGGRQHGGRCDRGPRGERARPPV